jgi:hypothetical protein
MTTLIDVRSSSVPRAYLCPASLVEPELRIETTDPEPANEGSASHACLQEWIPNGYRSGAIDENAQIFGVEEKEVGYLARAGWSLWEQIRDRYGFREPVTEHEFQPFEGDVVRLTGHTDVVDLSSDDGTGTIRILDHKFGRVEPDAEHQLKAYAFLSLQEWPEFERVWAAQAQVRTREIIPYGSPWTREELGRWFQAFEGRVADGLIRLKSGPSSPRAELFHPSAEACRYCRRAVGCPGRSAFLADCLNDLAPGNLPLHEALARANMVAAFADDKIKAIKAEVAAAGGKLGRLELETVELRKIDAATAMETLLACLQVPDEVSVLECCTLSKSKLEPIIRKNSPPRQGAKNIRALYEQLEAVDAFKVEYQEHLKVRKNGDDDANTDESAQTAISRG